MHVFIEIKSWKGLYCFSWSPVNYWILWFATQQEWFWGFADGNLCLYRIYFAFVFPVISSTILWLISEQFLLCCLTTCLVLIWSRDFNSKELFCTIFLSDILVFQCLRCCSFRFYWGNSSEGWNCLGGKNERPFSCFYFISRRALWRDHPWLAHNFQ